MRTHPFHFLTISIAHTFDREGLIDFLCWKNPEIDYKALPDDELTREDCIRLVERILNEKT